MKPHNEVTKPEFTLNQPLVYSAENNASQWMKENNVTIVPTVLYTELLSVLRKMAICLLGQLLSFFQMTNSRNNLSS